MTSNKVLRWWPLIGILGMVLVGMAVGKASNPIDDWFIRFGRAHRPLGVLLLFTDGRAVVLLCAVIVLTALYRRRWRLAAILVATPAAALLAVRILKRLFGRERGAALAYPSGHVTLAIVVTSMAVLLVGATLWTIMAAVVINVLGLLGQAFTYHYFTDTIGAVFLGTALVCVAFLAAGLDRCQPHCDLDHSGG